jgi:hypothetical protein
MEFPLLTNIALWVQWWTERNHETLSQDLGYNLGIYVLFTALALLSTGLEVWQGASFEAAHVSWLIMLIGLF